VEIEFDPAKSRLNLRARGLSFELAAHFDFDSAFIVEDARRDYGETRYRALGMMGEDLAVLVFTMPGAIVRVISLRLANRKERAIYGK
jgi:uncharacterized DUF497 family protein